MRRIDRFRAMSAEELAEMFEYKACRWCSYYDEPNDKCSINIVTRNLSHCRVGITEGLNQDDNPMPELAIGDIVEIAPVDGIPAKRYVILPNNVAILVNDFSQSEPATRITLERLRALSCRFVWRYFPNEYLVIWRADNER